MKRIVSGVAAVMLLLGALSPAMAVERRGGLLGFLGGCCFGLRTSGAYNEGKDIHWREWVMLVPFVGIVFAIWNGIDGANGITRGEYAKQYGAMYY